jgi:predicted lipoprotein with Yx(FWY)xxD motif
MARSMRHPSGLSALVIFIGLLTACGSSSPPTSSAPSTSSAAATPTPAPALIQTGQATVAGTMTTVLTDSQGMTLYYRTTDASTKVTCTGTCASNWPPVLLPTGAPTGSSSVTGTLSVLAGPNGTQVLYNGHPLYRWAHDTAAGQATGQGIGGFLVATAGLAASS